jgi:hypothetical protein
LEFLTTSFCCFSAAFFEAIKLIAPPEEDTARSPVVAEFPRKVLLSTRRELSRLLMAPPKKEAELLAKRQRETERSESEALIAPPEVELFCSNRTLSRATVDPLIKIAAPPKLFSAMFSRLLMFERSIDSSLGWYKRKLEMVKQEIREKVEC